MTSSQRVVKYAAIALAILIILSMISGVVWLFRNVFQIGIFNVYDNTPLSSETYDLDNYKNININVGASTLTIKSCDNSTLEITENIKYQVTNEELIIKDENRRYNKNSHITLCITNPTVFDNVIIDGGAGNISISNLEAKQVKFELGAGNVTIDNITSLKSFKLDGGAGDVKIFNALMTNADIDMGVGNFTINGILSGDADIDMGVGNLDITLTDGLENYKFDVDKGIGDIKIDGIKKSSGVYGTGSTLVQIDGGVGNIKIK